MTAEPPVLAARGGLVYHDPRRDYQSRQDTRDLTCDSSCFRAAPEGVGVSRRPDEGAVVTRVEEGSPLEGNLTWRYSVVTDRLITAGPNSPPWEAVVRRGHVHATVS